MKITELNHTPTKAECLEAVDALRKQIDDGTIVAFAAVGIQASDVVSSFMGSSRPVSRLRMIGACSRLHHYVNSQCDE